MGVRFAPFFATIQEKLEISIKANINSLIISYESDLKYEIDFHLGKLESQYKKFEADYNIPVILEEYSFDFKRLFATGNANLFIRMGIGGAMGYVLGGVGAVILGPILGTIAFIATIFGGTKALQKYIDAKQKEQITEMNIVLNENLDKIFIDIEKDLNNKITTIHEVVLENFKSTAYEPYNFNLDKLQEIENSMIKKSKVLEGNNQTVNNLEKDYNTTNELVTKYIGKLEIL